MIKKFIIILMAIISSLEAGSCYSILTQTGTFTPVYPYNFMNNLNFKLPKCNLLNETIVFDNNLSYVGCYKYYKDANYTLHHLKFNFRTPKIVRHKVTFQDKYVIFPTSSDVRIKNINKILEKYKPKKILSLFPQKFDGNSIVFKDLNKVIFLPVINSYFFYKLDKRDSFSTKVMILYNGVYSIDSLYKKLKNNDILEKLNNNTYILKIPLYISPTATLVVNNKTILLENRPKPIFIIYNGKFFAKNSKFITWNVYENKYSKREYIAPNELLLIGLQRPRPYIMGLTGSRTYFVNNTFRGLGFHSASATFGISLAHFPKDLIFNRFDLFSYLSKRGRAEGIYVGNTMYDNMMGFYCSEIKNTALVGNLMYNNVIYDIDPHDYSRNLIIARNITAKAHHAHGIVISRQVNHSIIAQNLSINNHSAGIMLDRLSYHNLVYDNLSALNGYMGISIQESDNNLIYKNKLIGNRIDGIIVRNSLRTSIKDNIISYNIKNGIEVLTKNIDGLIYRDFARDPYHKATSTVVENNTITDNLLNNITVKNNAAIYMKNNKVLNSNVRNYGGDLSLFTGRIAQNHGRFELYGIGNPFRAISSDLRRINSSALHTAIQILIDSSCKNDFVSGILAKIYIDKFKNDELATKEYIRGISLLHMNDMFSYGFFKLSLAKTKDDYINAISYIAQSIIFGDNRGKLDLAQIIYLAPVNKTDINEAFKKAIKRLEYYKIFYNKSSSLCEMSARKSLQIESALKIFKYRYKHSNVKDYYSFCKLAEQKFNAFPKNIIRKINLIIYKANHPKKAYYKKLLKENQIIRDTKACKLVSIRLKRIMNSLNKFYKFKQVKMMKFISPYIGQYLRRINEFRIKKVTKKEIYDLIEEYK